MLAALRRASRSPLRWPLLYLFEERRLKRRDTSVLRLRLPSLEALDRLAARVAFVGLVLLSAGIVVGLTRFDTGDLDAAMAVTVVIWAALRRGAVAAPRGGHSRAAPRVVARRRVRPRRGRPAPDPLRVMKLALVGVSHHTRSGRAARAGRGRSRLGRDARTRARAANGWHEAVVLSTCNRTELYLASDDDGASRSSSRTVRCSHWPARTRTRSPRSPTGSRTSLRRSTCSAWLPASTRWCQARARSSGRCATRSRRALRARCSTGLFRQALHAGRRARVETAIGESPASVPAAAAALAQQVFERARRPPSRARRSRQDERADRAQPPVARRDASRPSRTGPSTRAERARVVARGTGRRRST